ncbi:hypothetical protein Q31a_47390 [Aureliella helgolandensis]|uniref:Uncharacterized protein n=1 Tax=Aureliella helgolandensis TaxID=2527968 RepID=A0A518GCN8_9BACT|nr:hypothetical protein Q31a_47390 [Aureliella helgolandensis]
MEPIVGEGAPQLVTRSGRGLCQIYCHTPILPNENRHVPQTLNQRVQGSSPCGGTKHRIPGNPQASMAGFPRDFFVSRGRGGLLTCRAVTTAAFEKVWQLPNRRTNGSLPLLVSHLEVIPFSNAARMSHPCVDDVVGKLLLHVREFSTTSRHHAPCEATRDQARGLHVAQKPPHFLFHSAIGPTVSGIRWRASRLRPSAPWRRRVRPGRGWRGGRGTGATTSVFQFRCRRRTVCRRGLHGV